MKRMIKFSKAYINRKEYKAVKKVLKSGWLTTGKVTEQFEQEFADYVGSAYALAVSSCTVGLEMALRCLGIGRDDLVVVPSFTFCATAQAVENVGGRVAFGDIGLYDLCLNPRCPITREALEDAKAVIPVHLGGNDAYTKYDIPVVEDSAHRIEKGQCVNNPNLVVFSFYPTKNMTTGEGGMICTNDKEQYEWLKKCRSHGRTVLAGHGYDVEFCGLKANLPDVLSAIGLEQVRKLDKMTQMRNDCIDEYNRQLGKSWMGNHLYPIFKNDRDKFIDYMKKNGVQCSAHFSPLHKMTAYKWFEDVHLPVSEEMGKTEVSLPLYPGLTKKEITYICDLIKKYD